MKPAGLFFALWLGARVADGAEVIHHSEILPPVPASVAVGAAFVERVVVRTDKDARLEAAYLPHAGDALDGGVEVRGVDWSQQETASERVFDIRLGYQIFRGVRGEERVPIPEFKLHFMASGRPAALVVPAWEIKLAALIPAVQADADVTLRGPMPVLSYPLAAELRAFALSLSSLLLVYLSAAWQLALPPFRWRSRLPYEQAWHELNKLTRRENAAAEQAALKLIHKALNRSAGYTMFADRLDRYLGEQPQFEPLRGRFQQFFDGSWRVFFEIGTPGQKDVGWVGVSSPTQHPAAKLDRDQSATQPTRRSAGNSLPASTDDGGDNSLNWLMALAQAAMAIERGKA